MGPGEVTGDEQSKTVCEGCLGGENPGRKSWEDDYKAVGETPW